MTEYKIIISHSTTEAEQQANALAKEGWGICSYQYDRPTHAILLIRDVAPRSPTLHGHPVPSK